ncbi:MAG TPA: bifunctional 4-hydroxy-2-oxoglutarate aldolase/2-dehydro-3-deoxy-phosphogluconate aldolase [Bryobacteraceae bacterium]|jgi:2-dehydro-3-deoxyphosphogluconate aldolase/(4S)-4-hydroxy-2-oxoglutarate aldolase|nr:bifunctional 4-hydroxy-2-oxoglutarate aldolase/2-dehydro-3-deoxy-phosphogluconate aldolase [Bryobacteraceae bacterium]
MTKEEVRARIAELAIVPAVRAANAEDALFAAEAVSRGGLPIVELTMTVPDATGLIAHLVKKHPRMVVGAGTVLDLETARACLAAGAKFITSPGLDLEIVEFAVKEGVTVMPGVLTPSEIIAAVKAGADFVKIFPCSQLGGVDYLHALKAPFPHVSFIAAGGVNQQSAGKYLAAGATAVGIGADLVPPRAIVTREADWIEELARRYVQTVKHLRQAD